YSPNAKNPHKRIVYHRVIELLNKGESISKIAKDVGITRQTIYRIKRERTEH
ncbi:helix-turn-helix domain-containing protein, partial [Staphylococcus epidermidis]